MVHEKKVMEEKGLTCWSGRNKWGMYIIVASLHPDKPVADVGTPRHMAFTQDFIDERNSFYERGLFYGYRSAFF